MVEVGNWRSSKKKGWTEPASWELFLKNCHFAFLLGTGRIHVNWATVFNFKVSCCIQDLKKDLCPPKMFFHNVSLSSYLFTWALPHILTLLQLQKASAVRTLKEKCLGQMNDRTLRWTILLKIFWSILLSKTWYQKYLSRHYRMVQNSHCGSASSALISTMWYWAGDHFNPFCKKQLFWIQTSSTAFYNYLQLFLFLQELKLRGNEECYQQSYNWFL